MYMYIHVGSSVGRALCLEYRVSWVRVPPEVAHFSRKSDYLGCAVLLCLVCLTLLASFFLPSHLSFKNMNTVHGRVPPEAAHFF